MSIRKNFASTKDPQETISNPQRHDGPKPTDFSTLYLNLVMSKLVVFTQRCVEISETSGSQNIARKQHVIKNIIKPSEEHPRPTKKGMNHACEWNAFGV